MRNRFLIAYDISDPKRLRMMHRKLLGYGDPLQYSLFRADLNDVEQVLMTTDVKKIMNLREDRVAIVDLGPASGRARLCMRWLGRSAGLTERRFVVI